MLECYLRGELLQRALKTPMNPSIKEIVDAAVKEFGIVFAKDDIVDNAHMLGIGNWLRTALEAAFNRGKEEATKEWAEGDAKEEIKMYQRGQADIIQKLKGKVEKLQNDDEVVENPQWEYGHDFALSQVIQLLSDNSQEKKPCNCGATDDSPIHETWCHTNDGESKALLAKGDGEK